MHVVQIYILSCSLCPIFTKFGEYFGAGVTSRAVYISHQIVSVKAANRSFVCGYAPSTTEEDGGRRRRRREDESENEQQSSRAKAVQPKDSLSNENASKTLTEHHAALARKRKGLGLLNI